jgi:hypothetical protein
MPSDFHPHNPTSTHTNTHTHLYTHKHTHTPLHTQTHTHTPTHTNTHTHTSTHTHAHTHTPLPQPPPPHLHLTPPSPNTSHRFTYIDADPRRPSLSTMFDDYLDLLPAYSGALGPQGQVPSLQDMQVSPRNPKPQTPNPTPDTRKIENDIRFFERVSKSGMSKGDAHVGAFQSIYFLSKPQPRLPHPKPQTPTPHSNPQTPNPQIPKPHFRHTQTLIPWRFVSSFLARS